MTSVPFEPEEQHLRVRRTARCVVLGPGRAAEVWIVCHGYGQLATRFLRRFAPVATDARRVVAPEALNRFYLDGRIGPHGPDSPVGATWMTREDRLAEIDDYVGYLDAVHDRYAAGGVRVIALGFSQGVATVARWAAGTDRRIDHVVLWAGGLPPELAPGPELFRSASLTLVAGAQDDMVTVQAMETIAQRLADAGRPCDTLVHAGGHEITAEGLLALAVRVRDGHPT